MSEVQNKKFLLNLFFECQYQEVLPLINGKILEYDTSYELICLNETWYPMAFFKVIIPTDELADYIYVDGTEHNATFGFDKIYFAKAGRKYTVKELLAKLPQKYKL